MENKYYYSFLAQKHYICICKFLLLHVYHY